MNKFALTLFFAATALLTPELAQSQSDYTYFVRQIQMPDPDDGSGGWDVDVDQKGTQQSPLAINPNGARFELWTLKADPLTSYLLDTTYVNSYIPVAEINIKTEDPYDVIPRTRADRPFDVDITVSGLSPDPDAPDAAKSVKLLHHVQAYPNKSNGDNIDRGAATLHSQGSLASNDTHTLNYTVTAIPGADRSKVRGEERFSVFSLEDFQAPESQLDSEFLQIWPVADATVDGMTAGDVITNSLPNVTVTLKDLYPDSYTYVQIYNGPQVLGTEGTIVPGASYLLDRSTPRNQKKIFVKNWESLVPTDGEWTLEVITITPFGADRLSHTTFTADRTIEVRGSVTSLE